MKKHSVEMTITDSCGKKLTGTMESDAISKLKELHGLDGTSEMYEVLMEELNSNEK
jgi:hypothetical protein